MRNAIVAAQIIFSVGEGCPKWCVPKINMLLILEFGYARNLESGRDSHVFYIFLVSNRPEFRRESNWLQMKVGATGENIMWGQQSEL